MKFRNFIYLVALFVAIEALSFFGWQYPVVGVFAWLGIVALTFAVALVRPEAALGAVMAELVLGGKGYLFSLPIGQADLSLRLGIFLAVMIGSAVTTIRLHNVWGTQWRFRWLWLGWIAIAVWAAVVGLLRGNGFGAVFNDANAFLFLALAPAFGLLRTREHLMHVLYWIGAAIIVLALKTALVQGLFTHYASTDLVLLYKWVRDTGVGEVTYIIGHLYRVFFQSHVYGLLAFFTGIGLAVARPKRQWLWTVVAGLGAYVVVVSLSRSFWLGGLVALALALVGMLSRRSFRVCIAPVSFFAAIALLVAYVGFQWTLNFPGLWGGGGSGGTLVRARSDIQAESAASSRRELLPVITRAMFDHPFTGSGLGTSLTYQTKDPRVNTAKTSKGTAYTTTAFELGYHGFALQFGLVLVLAWLYLLFRFLQQGLTILRLHSPDRPIVAGLWLSVFALCTLHLTTPYLNHPLGFGFILLAAAAFTLLDPRYARR
ncbi:MAG: hypothetical protein AAB445_00440 [Patescibacteria group bacterium]